jgi:hypothetical protein
MIEKAIIITNDKGGETLFEWFIRQNHVPFDLNYHQLKELYKDFTKEVISLFKLTNSQYYWFGSNGRLMSDEGADLIDSNNFKIDRDVLRTIIRDNILEELLPE